MFSKIKGFRLIPRRYFQALSVQPEKREGNMIVVDSALDFKKRLANREQLERTIKRRGLDKTVDVPKLYDQRQKYKEADKQKRAVIPRIKHWTDIIKKVKVVPNVTTEMAEEKLRNARSDFKSAENNLDAMEAIFFSSYLSLPNDLLGTTPDHREIILNFGIKSDVESPCHLQWQQYIDYIDENTYYLKAAASEFDLWFPLQCSEYFERSGFTLFKNPDFTRTIIVEGAAVPLNETFLIPQHFDERFTNLLHLIGNGSMMSFLGFLGDTIFDFSLMPTQWVAVGKLYKPTTCNDHGLYDTTQSTAVQLLIVGTKQQLVQKYQQTLVLICDLLKMLNIHYRVVNIPAKELHVSECFATSIEMYAPSLKNYIEIGRISNYDEFISRRLNIRTNGDGKLGGEKPNIVSATVCNVTKLIAIMLETNNGEILHSLSKIKIV